MAVTFVGNLFKKANRIGSLGARFSGNRGAITAQITPGRNRAEDRARDRKRFRRLLTLIVRHMRRNFRSKSPRDSGALARGWRFKRRIRGGRLTGYVDISNPSAPYWRYLQFGDGKHRDFMNPIIELSVNQAITQWIAEGGWEINV